MNTKVAVRHTQKRMIGRHLGQPRLRGCFEGNKVRQQLPESAHCLLLHLCQSSSSSLLPLLLLLLHLQLLALPNLCLMLLLISCEDSWLQEISYEPLPLGDNWLLLLSCLLLLLLHMKLEGCLPTQVHSIDGRQAHNTPHTLVHSPRPYHTNHFGAQHTHHMMWLQGAIKPLTQLLLHHTHNSLGHRAVPIMVLPARLATIHRATHTAAVVLVHALCGGQTIQNQPPKHLLERVVPLQLPQMALGCRNGFTAPIHINRVQAHTRRRNTRNKILVVPQSGLKQRP
jgi:hypothetical protein